MLMVQDDDRLEDYNVESRVADFISNAKEEVRLSC